MRFLPIVRRELRVGSRRRGTYWSRSLAGLVAVSICGFVLLEATSSLPRQLGKVLFQTLAAVFGFVSLFAGVRHTADCLSQEKRDGTLGLLFLTDLKGYDVVLGKLVSTSMQAVYGLLAIVPVLAIPLLLGGVSFWEFGRMVVVLVNVMFFSLAAGLMVSAVSREARKAIGGTLLLILLVHGGLPALGAYVGYRHQAPISEGWAMPSAGYAFAHVTDAMYRGRAAQYWSSVGTTHLMAWGFLAAASVVVRRSWRDRPERAGGLGWRAGWRRWVYGKERDARAFREESLEINPCLWLGARHRMRPVMIWGLLGFIGALWLLGWAKLGADWLEIEVAVMTMYVAHLGLKLALASEACQRLGPERREGTLELLLATPLSVREILHGQMLVLRRQFLGPVLVVLAADCLVVASGWHGVGSVSREGWIWFCLAGIGTFLADLYTLAWVGLWVGLTARRGNRAAGATVARVLILPWLLWLGLLVVREVFRMVPGPSGGGSFMLLWVVIALGNNAVFLVYSRLRLDRDLRWVASERFEAGGGIWRGLSGLFARDKAMAVSGPGSERIVDVPEGASRDG
jgi:hypothetical protein